MGIILKNKVLHCEFCDFTTKIPIGLRVHKGYKHEKKYGSKKANAISKNKNTNFKNDTTYY